MYQALSFIQDEYLRNLFCLTFILLSLIAGACLEWRRPKQVVVDAAVDKLRLGRKFVLLLCALVGFSLALRFYGLSWGLPNPYHPDEFEEAGFLRNMMRNSTIDPHYSQQPPLVLYLAWPFSHLLEQVGYFTDNLLVRNVLAGRIVNSLAGSFAVLLTFFLGLRVAGKQVGLIAALLLAVSPLAVTNSRYMKQDSLLLLFVVACALAVLKAAQEKRPFWLYVGGVCAGLAAASKYSGAACIAILCSYPFLLKTEFSLRLDWKALKHLALAILLAVAAFIAAMPYVVFSAENFAALLRGIELESIHARSGHHGYAVDAWSQLWMFHFSRSLLPSIDVLATLAALIGAGIMIKRRYLPGLWVLAVLLCFYLPAEMAWSKPPPQPDRYVLACLPFLGILSGLGIKELKRFISPPLVYALTALMLLLPAIRTLGLASELTYDTRAQMGDWLAANLEAGSKVVVAGGAAYLPRVPAKFQSIPARKVIGKDKSRAVEELRASGADYLLISDFSAGRFDLQTLPAIAENARKKRQFEALERIDRELPLLTRIEPKWGSYGFHNPTLSLYKLKS